MKFSGLFKAFCLITKSAMKSFQPSGRSQGHGLQLVTCFKQLQTQARSNQKFSSAIGCNYLLNLQMLLNPSKPRQYARKPRLALKHMNDFHCISKDFILYSTVLYLMRIQHLTSRLPCALSHKTQTRATCVMFHHVWLCLHNRTRSRCGAQSRSQGTVFKLGLIEKR